MALQAEQLERTAAIAEARRELDRVTVWAAAHANDAEADPAVADAQLRRILADVNRRLLAIADYAGETVAQIEPRLVQIEEQGAEAVRALRSGFRSAADSRFAQIVVAREAIDEALARLDDRFRSMARTARDGATATLETVRRLSLVLLLLAGLLAIGLSVSIVRSLGRLRREGRYLASMGGDPPKVQIPALSDQQVANFGKAMMAYLAERDRQKALTRETAAAESRYGALLETGGFGYFRLLGSKLEEANPALARLLGYDDLADLRGAVGSVREDLFFDGEEHEQLQSEVRALGSVSMFELRLRSKRSEPLWTHIVARQVGNGQTLRFEALVIDITDRKISQDEMVSELERARFADRAKTEFLANVSHELRTPLNAIIGFSEIMLDEDLRPRNPETLEEYLNDIHESGLHLLSLVSDLLDMSRIEAGQAELREEELKVPDLVESAVRMVRRQAAEGRVKVGIKEARQDCYLRGDRRAVKQILVNLLSNAVKFTPSGGSVTVQCRPGARGTYDITVTDTGVGIEADDLPKVFERFGQVNGAPRIHGPGTGLGLPLTQALVRQHGGDLSIRSRPQKGTTVKVSFPADRVVRPSALGMV